MWAGFGIVIIVGALLLPILLIFGWYGYLPLMSFLRGFLPETTAELVAEALIPAAAILLPLSLYLGVRRVVAGITLTRSAFNSSTNSPHTQRTRAG